MKYKNVYRYLILFIPLHLIIAFYGCREDIITSSGKTGLTYPTTLYPVSVEKREELQNEFDTLNNFKICSKLNKYGFIGSDSYNRVYQSVAINKDSAFTLAVNTILKNSKYVNVKNRTALLSSPYSIMEGNIEGTQWKIVFGPQIYNGFELPDVRVIVWIYGNEPYVITGNWYSDIYIPSEYRIDKEAAKQKIVGEKIIWYDSSGNPKEFIVTNESIGDNISNAINPVEKENSIELRVSWKIPIKFFSMDAGWYIYLDVMSGEIVKITQEFRT